MIRLGVIGYGGRMQGVVALMKRLGAGTEVVAVTDVRNDAIREQIKVAGDDPSRVTFYTDPDEMLDKEQLDGAMVGTRCSLHTKMALKVLKRGLPLYLEKPIATNMDDLRALRDASETTKSEVVVSFPLRVTPLVQLAKEIIDSGKIGTVENVNAWNDVPYGACYYQAWYRDENETQGLFLQKATHDIDYINYLVGIKPVWICAMNSKRVFGGDKPAGLKCDDCTEWDDCLESPFHAHFTKQERKEVHMTGWTQCCFAQDTGNEDSGSAIIEYESGMHATYAQNFFARKKAGRRGARLYGYKGTIEFDWYTEELKVYMHQVPRVETYKVEATASHGGGDTVLCDSFVRVIQGKAKSVSPLSAGIQSVLMCLKAKESAKTRTFQKIEF